MQQATELSSKLSSGNAPNNVISVSSSIDHFSVANADFFPIPEKLLNE